LAFFARFELDTEKEGVSLILRLLNRQVDAVSEEMSGEDAVALEFAFGGVGRGFVDLVDISGWICDRRILTRAI
jgi:hypothetical protein